jgi:hypothetical protein
VLADHSASVAEPAPGGPGTERRAG